MQASRFRKKFSNKSQRNIKPHAGMRTTDKDQLRDKAVLDIADRFHGEFSWSA